MSLSLQGVVEICYSNQDLLDEFNRLTGHQLGQPAHPMLLMVDEATGKWSTSCREFIYFVYLSVWLPQGGAPIEQLEMDARTWASKRERT